MNLDLEPRYLDMILKILTIYAPDCEIRVFGSRVRGTSRKYSDVDLLIVGKNRLDTKNIYRLKEAFSCSDLPYLVDIQDWLTITDSFRETIGNNYIVIKKAVSLVEE
jgi:type I restriction enzyme S subunit